MRKGESRPDLRRARTGECPVCLGSFRAVGDTYRRKQKFCSKACWANRGRPKNLSCPTCLVEFKSLDKGRKYCSLTCRNSHYRVRFKGKNSHLWEGGKTARNKLLRCSAAFRQWREAVFKRDNYTCVVCTRRSAKGAFVEIHPDHIKPLATHPDLAFDLNNGRTLCVDCHKNTDTWAWKARWGTG